MIDCSHGNSAKDFRQQPKVAEEVAAQIASGDDNIAGVMLESHLNEGNQKQVHGQQLAYGTSITDGCINWDSTVPILESLAESVRARRST